MDQTLRLPALLLLFSLTACVTNKSSDPRLASIVHQCFRTTDDAVLFQTSSCPPLDGMSATSTCVTVKYLSSFSPPITLRDYNANAAGAAGRVSDELSARSSVSRGLLRPRERASLLGILKSGTPFTVQNMRRFSHPEQGSIWITTAKIDEGEFSGESITLPWDNLSLEFNGEGGWMKDFVQRQPFIDDPYRPQINSTKMVPCEASAKTE
jgi:hypothetical protein